MNARASRHVVTFSNYDLTEYGVFLRAKAVPEFEITLDEGGMANGLSVPGRFAHLVGDGSSEIVDRDWAEMPGFLFRDQKEILKLALEAERFACWSDCGLGKTLIEFEFARQVAAKTGGRVLIITLAHLVADLVSEAAKFYGDKLPVRILDSRKEMREWCKGEGSAVAITNYEKMNPDGGPETQVVNEMKLLAGIVLDESSRLKTGGGKQKWALIKSAKGIRYKLSCTATPAPNEVMEFARQAAFLERIRGESDVMWTYFTRDKVTQEWTVKAHARPHFFRWMASWSIYLRNPERYGWSRGIAPVPEPVFFEHRIPATGEQLALAAEVAAQESGKNARNGKHGKKKGQRGGELLPAEISLGMVGRNILSQVAKGFRYRKVICSRVNGPECGPNEAAHMTGVATGSRKASATEPDAPAASKTNYDLVASNKPAAVARLIEAEARAGRQVLVWCVFDAEVDVIMAELEKLGVPAVSLGGSDKKSERAGILNEFRTGRAAVLVSKAGMLGFGFNFQFCGSMVFSGFTDSFEAFYQAVRRAFRFGQMRRLRVHLPFVPELEEAILRNVLRKAAQFDVLITEQEDAYIKAMEELARDPALKVDDITEVAA